MRTCALQSGSNGNCIYVESDGVRLLFDAGISGVRAERRLAALGRDIRDVDALILSHDHIDHVRSAGVFHRKFGLPIHATRPTFEQIRANIGPVREIHYFRSGDVLTIGRLIVETLPTPHDAADGVVFVVDDGRTRLGVFTDVGHSFVELGAQLGTVNACYLESNYDDHLLSVGPYPARLKQRIRGRGGHLSNHEAADLVRETASESLRLVVLAHLSAQNNRPELAMATHRRVLGEDFPLVVASRHEATEMFAL